MDVLDLDFPNLSSIELPSLKRVTITTKCYAPCREGTHPNYFLSAIPSSKMSSVEMLEIRKVAPKIESSCEILTKIWRIFPNLKHLAVSLIGSLDKNTSRVDWGNMKRFFRNLHQCPSNVSRLTFHVEITSSFSELMEAMDVSEGLDGVQGE